LAKIQAVNLGESCHGIQPVAVFAISAELPDSDHTPVDNELQNLIPNLMLAILTLVWQREDLVFGVDMGVYHTTRQNPRIPIVLDGFLSLGGVRRKGAIGASVTGAGS